LSYIIAQHVSPTHISMLMSLLSPMTKLQVEDLVDRQSPKPGVVYITPPNKDVILEQGQLRLTEPQAAIGPKPSVNHFFHSLADEVGEQAIGIILSGTGSDGAAGIRAIKAAGGITIAQEPETAKYDGMPKAAIHTGNVDLILAPGKIGPALERLLTLPRGLPLDADEASDTDEYTQISNLVRINTAFKLNDYKPATVRRRIARRMNIVGVDTLKAYIAYLEDHREESHALMRDAFISVTAFFRDQDAFSVLAQMIKKVVQERENSEVIRCWVPGCASGEEVYSIAMLFEEALRNQGKASLQYMIFASDLDDNALERARAALYPVSELENVPKALRDFYMQIMGDHYRIIKNIRNRIVFARQNVIEDPPFAHLDLISCRNLLIYLNPPVQKRVLEIFHYALNPGGWLFLGKSETIDQHNDLFKVVDRRTRLYQRLEGIPHYVLPIGVSRDQSGNQESGRAIATSTDWISMRTLEELAERYAPPSLVINTEDNVVHFHGNLKPLLNFPKGRADLYLFELVDPALRAELRALVYRCRRDLQLAQGSAWPIEINGQRHTVTPVVSPLDVGRKALLLISFPVTRLEIEGKRAMVSATSDERDNLIIRELEQELANTRTHLNVVVEELETSNEELQSLNEELQSTNEELQSANEELQTANEELQSTNEELLTVNEELQVKSAELEITASDLINVKESLTFPLIVVDEQLRITQANAACSAIVVIDAPLEGSALNSVQWRVEIAGLSGQVRSVLKDGQQHRTTICSEKGSIYSLNIMPYRQEQGAITGAVLIFEDITVQYEAGQALRESEERFRQVTESLPQLIWTCTADGVCDYLSPQWMRYTGKIEAERLNNDWLEQLHPEDRQRTLLEQLHPEDRQRTLDEWQTTVAQGRHFASEFRIRRHDGAYRWFHTLAVPLRDEQGAIVKWFGSNTDIDDIKQTEKALRESEEKFYQAMLHAPIGKALVAPNGHWLDVNPVLCRIVGYTEAELLARDFQSITHPNDLDVDLAYVQQLLAGEIETYQIDKRLLHQDGHVVWIQLNVSLVRDGSRAPCYFISQIQDITERKRAEIILIEAHAKAEAANRAKSNFLANMSHEIRTPMNVVLGLAQLLLDTELTSHQRDYLTKLHHSARSLLGILNDILDYSKIEAGKLNLEAVEIELAELLESTSRLFSLAAESKGIELTFDIALDIPPVLIGDPLRLKQILNNLLGNAVKFTDQGHIQLSIRQLQKQDDDMTLQISIHDTGIGMAPEQIGRLFQAFEQADASTTRQFGGSGLGLAITKQLVEMMGGNLSVESEQGQGSAFTFTVCLKIPFNSAQQHTATALHSMRTLIVENHAVSCDVLRNILAGWSFQVDAVHSVEESLAKAVDMHRSGQPYELVLVNWKLSGIGGIEFVRRFREEAAKLSTSICQTIVVMATAYRHQEIQQAAQDLQIDAILEKPVIPSRLFNLVNGLQSGSRQSERLGSECSPCSDLQDGRNRLQTLQGSRLLLVEDNLTNQLVAQDLLKKMGLSVTTASNGREAIEQASVQRFDIILMDLQMPEMDGLEATKHLRALPEGQTVPIIAMTAAVMSADREASLSVGMNDFMTKPIDVDKLTSILLRWIPPIADDKSPIPPKTATGTAGSPFSVAGLDLAKAVMRLGGDWALLRRTLHNFARDFADSTTALDEYLAQGRWPEARRLIHTIKGMALSIEAHPLHEIAEQFEQELEATQYRSKERFQAALTETLAKIAAAPETESAGLSDPNNAQIKTLVDEIQATLALSGFVAPALIDALGQHCAQPKQRALFLKFKSQVDVFNYAAAQATLIELAALSQKDSEG
ncbi:MAG: PAS domain S-box protein, partial [Candidatus Competibacteraceae bacterium]|nr:PAS domain S-box protein [Candidatus Competibacteraceae bacterium]